MARASLVPGFRFHPTDAELVMYYLKRKVLGKNIIVDAVAEVNIYDFSPWDLRDKSALKNGDLEWFFFCPKSKKYNSGSRYNRATEIGFWKATGKDRTVTYKGRTVASIKTLVFHIGQSGKGDRTDWVMHEYRLQDEQLVSAGVVQDTYVLVKLFEKTGSGPKNGAQYGAPFNEEEWEDDAISSCSKALATLGPLETKQKDPATVNMYEPGSSTVTCTAYGTGGMIQRKQTGTGAIEMTVPAITHDGWLTEPESSIVMLSANERCKDSSVHPDDIMSLEDIALFLGVSKDFNVNNENEVVQVENMHENSTEAPNAEDGIYNELVNLVDLDEFNGGASACGSMPAVYMFDKPLDDLDVNLGAFYVD